MRATCFLLLTFVFLSLFFWTIFSGALLFISYLFLAMLAVVVVGYADTSILFFLGAREVRRGSESMFLEAAAQEAYKLAVPLPKLYFYDGSLERGFVFQNKHSISLVLSRSLLEHAQAAELSGICFELLLQVKKGMASKRTKVMFFLGAKSWLVHSFMGLTTGLIPSKEFQAVMSCFISYFLHPSMDLTFRLILGKGYFKKLQFLMSEYPSEYESLSKLNLKLRRPSELYSLPSRKLVEFSSISRSRHFQNILALELLPHEWDHFFKNQD